MNTIRFIGLCAFLLAHPAHAITFDAGQPLKDWVAAVESGSLDAIMKLYDQDAVMISTFAQHPLTKRDQIMGYYKKVVSNPDIDVVVSESHPRLFGNMAINTGEYTLNYTQDGEPVSIPARFSFTYRLRGDAWIIVDHHSSRVPIAEQSK